MAWLTIETYELLLHIHGREGLLLSLVNWLSEADGQAAGVAEELLEMVGISQEELALSAEALTI